ncbi:MAG: histidine triad nucleotide-binding protein [Endomicrobia bacterium]|nr:histidine triad nucleotide-binding protein [Endomicrobiia bacterium]MCX7716739.1 histidine triad nucleotide-binding protein [Endomicrobiia bacterium]
MNRECIFCKIINKEIKSEIVFENENIIVFKDINPQAPLHLLIVPKKHISSLNEIDDDNKSIIAEVFMTAKIIATQLGVENEGYRIVVNTGKNAGQEVFHIHFHFLSGRKFSWPPG